MLSGHLAKLRRVISVDVAGFSTQVSKILEGFIIVPKFLEPQEY